MAIATVPMIAAMVEVAVGTAAVAATAKAEAAMEVAAAAEMTDSAGDADIAMTVTVADAMSELIPVRHSTEEGDLITAAVETDLRHPIAAAAEVATAVAGDVLTDRVPSRPVTIPPTIRALRLGQRLQ